VGGEGQTRVKSMSPVATEIIIAKGKLKDLGVDRTERMVVGKRKQKNIQNEKFQDKAQD